MNTFDLKDIRAGGRVHFIGVGGVSMSALAEIMLHKGFEVTGSDINKSPLVERLEGLGMRYLGGHDACNAMGADLVVYTAAISPSNPELRAAASSGITTIERPVLLGAIMRGFRRSIAIAGTHGKTTTTSMLSYILLENGTDPTILVGGELGLLGGNVRTGSGDYFLAEACEYRRSFLEFSPFGGAVINIEPDHLDYYKDEDDYISAFREFARLIPPDGFLAVNADDSNVKKIICNLRCAVVDFAIDNKDAKIRAKNIRLNGRRASYGLYIDGNFVKEVTLGVTGRHNVLNSLCAIACSFALGLDIDKSVDALLNFTGADRRFQAKGRFNGADVVDDYAHHPTEIRATLNTAAGLGYKRIWCVFQPHTFSRTKALMDGFSTAFGNVHRVLLADIYAAREADDGSVSSAALAERINSVSKNCIYLGDFGKIEDYLAANAAPGDLIITMGAGDVYKVGEALVNGER